MKNLSVIIFLCISNLVAGQAYVPMPMQNCYWQISDNTFCSQAGATPPTSGSFQVYQIYPNSDTIIGTVKYVKFYVNTVSASTNGSCPLYWGTANGYWAAVRQDTLGRKIYTISPNQTAEQLLYNFNYIKGDTMKTTLGTYTWSPSGNDPFRMVDSVFYKAYSDGICRKTFRLKPFVINGQYTGNRFFTEGIGNEVGLGERVASISMSGTNYASQEQWSSFLTINNFTISALTTNTCSQVGIKDYNYRSEIIIYPNPASSLLTLKTDEEIISLAIYNTIGEAFSYKPLGSKSLDISNLSSGVYYLELKTIKGLVRKKFVKE